MNCIMVIEDEPVLRDNLVQMLSLEGYQAISAGDGASGIVLAQEARPDLILCDIAMTGLDGFEVIKRLHQDVRTASIPVIFLTAKVERDVMQRGLALGAKAYITKPFTLEELLDAIHTRLI